jgi:hypothetical protein
MFFTIRIAKSLGPSTLGKKTNILQDEVSLVYIYSRKIALGLAPAEWFGFLENILGMFPFAFEP